MTGYRSLSEPTMNGFFAASGRDKRHIGKRPAISPLSRKPYAAFRLAASLYRETGQPVSVIGPIPRPTCSEIDPQRHAQICAPDIVNLVWIDIRNPEIAGSSVAGFKLAGIRKRSVKSERSAPCDSMPDAKADPRSGTRFCMPSDVCSKITRSFIRFDQTGKTVKGHAKSSRERN